MKACLFCESSDNFGGQEHQILQQIGAIEESGVRCVLAAGRGSSIAAEAVRRGITWHPVTFRNSLHPPAILAVRRIIVRHGIDVAFCHSGHDATVLAIAARSLFFRRPLVLRVRTYLAGKPRATTVNSHSDRTLVPSNYLAKQITSDPSVNAGRVAVIRPIVSLGHSRQEALMPLPGALETWLRNHSPILTHAAMLRSEKDHALTLNAVARLVHDHPRLGCVIAGSGKKEDALRQLASRLDINDHVFFAGLLMPVAPLFVRSDLVVMPSRREPLGLAQLEALSLGVPVAVSDAGGLPETVSDGETGWVIPAEDLDAWVAGIGRALADPVEAGRRARAGSAWVGANFSPAAHLAALKSHVNQLRTGAKSKRRR
jgi:glycosyltransferase involved in cell wall biosynthesis